MSRLTCPRWVLPAATRRKQKKQEGLEGVDPVIPGETERAKAA